MRVGTNPMRVGLKRHQDRRRRAAPSRPGAPLTARVTAALPVQVELGHVDEQAPVPAPVVVAERVLAAEWRLRASGGPDDKAHYHCACGYVFEASVSTSVSCPNCGAGQAW
jgi:hypothetical protein